MTPIPKHRNNILDLAGNGIYKDGREIFMGAEEEFFGRKSRDSVYMTVPVQSKIMVKDDINNGSLTFDRREM